MGKEVLWVDHNPDTRQLLDIVTGLHPYSFGLKTATSVEEAIEMAREEVPSALVTAHLFPTNPRTYGYQILEAAIDHWPFYMHVPLKIIFTGDERASGMYDRYGADIVVKGVGGTQKYVLELLERKLAYVQPGTGIWTPTPRARTAT